MLKRLFGRPESKPALVQASRERMLEAVRESLARGRFAEAEVRTEVLIQRFPGDAEVHNETGRLRYALGDFEGAARAFAQACELAPRWPDARANLGQACQVRGRYAEAIGHFEHALQADPHHHEARFNLALSLAHCGDLEASLVISRRLVAGAPADAASHVLLAETLLRAGQFHEAWCEYAWRTRVADYQPFFRTYAQPEWLGEGLPGATVLIWPEQGYGDALQFVRLLLVAARRHADMSFVLEAEPALLRLMQVTFAGHPNIRVVAASDQISAFDRHASIMSLPRNLDASLGVNPAAMPYLRAAADELAPWRARVRAAAGAKLAVGLVWAGNARERHGAAEQALDVRRSAGAQAVSALCDVAGCAFFNLQVGGRSGEMAALGIPLVDFTGELADFAATAALVSCLDLVISVDTAVVHLAGGLARPVWMLSRFDCCWRWGRRGATSAWYPTLRAFYQPTSGDWAGAVAAIRAALVRAARTHAAGGG